MLKDTGLRDKVAIVTGGARGIGKAIVCLLAQEGANVTFFYNSSDEKAQALVSEGEANGWKISAYKVDIRNQTACAASVDEIATKLGRIDILVNNSGIVRDNLLAAMSQQEITDVVDTNLVGTMYMTQAVVPFMMRKRQGCIINMSSVGSIKPGRGQANYAASKGAVNAFTQAMAVELAARNIRVNAIAPGVIETEMSQDVRDLAGDEVLSKILLKRYGQADEVAHLVAFLASSNANYITGQILHIDGGFKMA